MTSSGPASRPLPNFQAHDHADSTRLRQASAPETLGIRPPAGIDCRAAADFRFTAAATPTQACESLARRLAAAQVARRANSCRRRSRAVCRCRCRGDSRKRPSATRDTSCQTLFVHNRTERAGRRSERGSFLKAGPEFERRPRQAGLLPPQAAPGRARRRSRPARRPNTSSIELSKNHHAVGPRRRARLEDPETWVSPGKWRGDAIDIKCAIEIIPRPIEISPPRSDIYEKPSGIDP